MPDTHFKETNPALTATAEIVTWLLDQQFQPEQPLSANCSGMRSLILAAQQGRSDVLDYLLRQGADFRELDQYGNNALWAACFANAADCITLLLQAGIDIDYQNPSGATALTYASSSGRAAAVEQLLQAGANPLLTTQDDFSALDLASNLQCLQLLRYAAKRGD
jgi:uncharacterized protein